VRTRFAGQVVLLTGASSGVGVELARQFAADGAQLALAARDVDRLEFEAVTDLSIFDTLMRVNSLGSVWCTAHAPSPRRSKSVLFPCHQRHPCSGCFRPVREHDRLPSSTIATAGTSARCPFPSLCSASRRFACSASFARTSSLSDRSVAAASTAVRAKSAKIAKAREAQRHQEWCRHVFTGGVVLPLDHATPAQ